MKRSIDCRLPILSLLVLAVLLLSAGIAFAQWDDKNAKPPTDDVMNEDHGGGDPDNPIPVIGGGGSESSQSGSVPPFPELVGEGDRERTSGDWLRLIGTITGVLGSVLFL
ncbi:MAG: hypothetical protein ABIH26_09160 [Candidatus Eisenbacteria bacterium]